MTDVFNGETDLNKKILEWTGNVKALARIKDLEMKQRKALFEEMFPEPKIGTQHFELGLGYKVTAVYQNEHKLDETSLQLVLPEIEKLGDKAKIELDNALKYKPSLVKKGYDSLSEDVKELFDECVVTKPKLGSLKLIEPKDK